MFPIILVIVFGLWFLFGRFLSRKTESIPIGYSVGLLAALIASIPFIAGAAKVRDYLVERNANDAGFATVQEYRQAQRLGYPTKASYDQGRAELEAARRSARESQARMDKEAAATERRRQRIANERATVSASRSSSGRSMTGTQQQASSGSAQNFASLEKEVRALLVKGESLARLSASACMPHMKLLQPQAKRLRAQVSQLPNTQESVWLRIAAAGLELCVSCHEGLRRQQCAQTREALQNLQ